MEAQIQYRAFLSYSHSDRAFAASLHRALESFRVPFKLVGTATALGPVPARLTPIFRDREELSASHSLSEAIEAALSQSSALIVVCSPSAASSRWVNEEIRFFKRLHGEKRIFAVIADGEPGATDMPGREAEECFPLALRFQVGTDGELTGQRTEPIATDLRPRGDGRRQGKLKLIAGLLGVRLDDLVRREAQRRQRRLAYIAAASVAGMATTSGLAIAANQARNEAEIQRNEAQRQRAEADGLVEFMLTDLRGKLEPVGRLDVLKSVGDRALDYYARQKLQDLDGDSLGRRARAMLLVAEVGDLQGNSESARRGFIEAARSTAELLRRDPNNWQRIYDHAQSEFWLAYDAHNRGDNKGALPHFLAYRDLGRRMMEVAPKKAESQIELASAEVNLGVAFTKEQRVVDALTSFDRASAMYKAIRPRTRDVALNLNQALGHKASTFFEAGDNRHALAARYEQLQVLHEPPLSPSDREVQEGTSVVLAQIGTVHLANGQIRAGKARLDEAVRKWGELVSVDPENNFWRGERNAAKLWKAVALSATDRATALDEIRSVAADQRQLIKTSPDWVHKINLLRMIAVQRALGEQDGSADEPVIAEARSKRSTFTPDERATLAAVLISRPENKSWREADQLLEDDQPSTWALIQRARVDKRLGKSVDRSGIPPKAFAGIFNEAASQ